MQPNLKSTKTFGICDSKSGFVYNLLVYFGKATSYNPKIDAGHTEKVFEDILMQLLGPCHHIFADRYYTTHKLIQYLSENIHYYTCTLNMNRINFPPQLRGLKLDHLSSKWYCSDDDGILCILVSTYETVSHTDVRSITQKPTMVHQYNYNMNGCDRVDQYLSYYGQISRGITKWWKRIFFWLLEVTQCNAHILYQITRDNDSA